MNLFIITFLNDLRNHAASGDGGRRWLEAFPVGKERRAPIRGQPHEAVPFAARTVKDTTPRAPKSTGNFNYFLGLWECKGAQGVQGEK